MASFNSLAAKCDLIARLDVDRFAHCEIISPFGLRPLISTAIKSHRETFLPSPCGRIERTNERCHQYDNEIPHVIL
jgi:hypothetical protein